MTDSHDTIRRIEELREKASRRGRIARSDGDVAYATPGWSDVLFLLDERERDRQQIARLTEALAAYELAVQAALRAAVTRAPLWAGIVAVCVVSPVGCWLWIDPRRAAGEGDTRP